MAALSLSVNHGDIQVDEASETAICSEIDERSGNIMDKITVGAHVKVTVVHYTSVLTNH